MRIDFKKVFSEFENGILNNQKKLEYNSCIKVFYGINKKGNIRLSFLSSVVPPKFNSIDAIEIEQGMEGKDNYWINFDLIDSGLTEVFYTFCDHMTESIYNVKEEKEALSLLIKHYNMWKKLFKPKRDTFLSEKDAKGLFGELYFMNSYLLEKYNQDDVIESWVGGNLLSKDFSLKDAWFEIKTISPNSESIHINSLTQLDSSTNGYLVIVKAETMASTYDDGCSKLLQLFNKIIDKLQNYETKQLFIEKIIKRSFVPTNELDNKYSFRVAETSRYLVDNSFPRIKAIDIKYQEVSGIEYDLIVASLEKFKVGD